MRFPELESLVPTPLEYIRTVQVLYVIHQISVVFGNVLDVLICCCSCLVFVRCVCVCVCVCVWGSTLLPLYMQSRVKHILECAYICLAQ